MLNFVFKKGTSWGKFFMVAGQCSRCPYTISQSNQIIQLLLKFHSIYKKRFGENQIPFPRRDKSKIASENVAKTMPLKKSTIYSAPALWLDIPPYISMNRSPKLPIIITKLYSEKTLPYRCSGAVSCSTKFHLSILNRNILLLRFGYGAPPKSQ